MNNIKPSNDRAIAQGKSINQPDNPPPLPKDWTNVDGATAFHLIDRHAESWEDTARMMDEWAAARVKADPLPSAFEHGKKMARTQDTEAAAAAHAFNEQQVCEHQAREESQWTPTSGAFRRINMSGSRS